jgi:hypothetical protein
MAADGTVRYMTEGEWRVGVNFNPSNMSKVDEIKSLVAKLIDMVLGSNNDPRSAALAATAYEEAAMWHVKAVTKGPK